MDKEQIKTLFGCDDDWAKVIKDSFDKNQEINEQIKEGTYPSPFPIVIKD